MKKVFTVLISAAMLLSVAGCGNSSSAAPAQAPTAPAPSSPSAPESATPAVSYPKLNLNMSCSGADLGIDAIAGKHMADYVAEQSGGNIKITVYPNAQLAGGSQAKTPELLAAGGGYELAFCSGANLSSLSELFQTHQLPFLFSSYDEASAMLDGTGGAYYAKLLDEKGIYLIGGMHNGLRHLTNSKRPVKVPADLAGLKIRIPSGEVGMQTFTAFGADPVAMNYSEVYTALQQKTIDGQENGYQTAGSANLHEVQKYLTEWAWQYDGWFLLANKQSWEGFDDATRELLLKAGKEALDFGRDTIVEEDAKYKQAFIDAGVEIFVPNKEELQAFIDVTIPIREKFVEKYGREVCQAWGVIS